MLLPSVLGVQPRWSGLRQRTPAGSLRRKQRGWTTMLNEFYWQLLKSCKDQRSKPQESIRKPKKPRVCSTVFEFNSLTHDDQSADECCPIHFVQLEESNSKLDSKSPLSNKSIFLFDFLTNCLPACQQLGELPAVSQRKHFELCTCFLFFF